jgi:hypothetical protein
MPITRSPGTASPPKEPKQRDDDGCGDVHRPRRLSPTPKNFQKVEFADILKGKAKFAQKADNGWVAMIQHYFVSAWLPATGHRNVSSSCARSARTSIPRG